MFTRVRFRISRTNQKKCLMDHFQIVRVNDYMDVVEIKWLILFGERVNEIIDLNYLGSRQL